MDWASHYSSDQRTSASRCRSTSTSCARRSGSWARRSTSSSNAPQNSSSASTNTSTPPPSARAKRPPSSTNSADTASSGTSPASSRRVPKNRRSAARRREVTLPPPTPTARTWRTTSAPTTCESRPSRRSTAMARRSTTTPRSRSAQTRPAAVDPPPSEILNNHAATRPIPTRRRPTRSASPTSATPNSRRRVRCGKNPGAVRASGRTATRRRRRTAARVSRTSSPRASTPRRTPTTTSPATTARTTASPRSTATPSPTKPPFRNWWRATGGSCRPRSCWWSWASDVVIYNLYMAEEGQQQQAVVQAGQSQQQLQVLLRDTMKQNKTLQNKNSKLESKYVELFKQHKALKKDHSLFLAFINRYFANNDLDPRPPLPETPIGQYEMPELQKIAELKDTAQRTRLQDLQRTLQDLERTLQRVENERKAQLQSALTQKESELNRLFEERVKEARENASKELSACLREVDSLKRINKQQSEELAELKGQLQQKHNELSRLGKEKLKIEHHLNNIRKREFAEELSPDKDKQQEKLMNERNEFLSLRQQLETLMIKRDQSKRELVEKEEQLAAECRKRQALQEEIEQMHRSQAELNEKYELVRECTVEELENLIFGHNSPEKTAIQQEAREEKRPEVKREDSTEIQHEYLKNVLVRYIKAETSGGFDQALMLLQILGTILKLDADSSHALQNYKHKRKQWWYIKY